MVLRTGHIFFFEGSIEEDYVEIPYPFKGDFWLLNDLWNNGVGFVLWI